MNKVAGSGVHARFIIILDWKMMMAIDCLVLIWLLIK